MRSVTGFSNADETSFKSVCLKVSKLFTFSAMIYR